MTGHLITSRGKRPTEAKLRAERLEEAISRAGSIGELERMAGIGQDHAARYAFWQPYAHLPGAASLDAGVAELKRLIRLGNAS